MEKASQGDSNPIPRIGLGKGHVIPGKKAAPNLRTPVSIEAVATQQPETLSHSAPQYGRRIFVALMFCISTGCRRSTLARIKKSDVKMDYGEIILHRRKGRKDKVWNIFRVNWSEPPLAPYFREYQKEFDSADCLFAKGSSLVMIDQYDEKKEIKQCKLSASSIDGEMNTTITVPIVPWIVKPLPLLQ